MMPKQYDDSESQLVGDRLGIMELKHLFYRVGDVMRINKKSSLI